MRLYPLAHSLTQINYIFQSPRVSPFSGFVRFIQLYIVQIKAYSMKPNITRSLFSLISGLFSNIRPEQINITEQINIICKAFEPPLGHYKCLILHLIHIDSPRPVFLFISCIFLGLSLQIVPSSTTWLIELDLINYPGR